MRLIGNKPPKTWPIKVFWILVIIHVPMIALMVVTSIVEGTLLSMIEFWAVTVPLYFLSLLLDPLKLFSAIIAGYLIWYACQFDWTPFFRYVAGTPDNFVRGRRLLGPNDLRNRLASRRMTLNQRSRQIDGRINE